MDEKISELLIFLRDNETKGMDLFDVYSPSDIFENLMEVNSTYQYLWDKELIQLKGPFVKPSNEGIEWLSDYFHDFKFRDTNPRVSSSIKDNKIRILKYLITLPSNATPSNERVIRATGLSKDEYNIAKPLLFKDGFVGGGFSNIYIQPEGRLHLEQFLETEQSYSQNLRTENPSISIQEYVQTKIHNENSFNDNKGVINQDFKLSSDRDIAQSVTTPSKKQDAPNTIWYKRPLFKYYLLPVAVALTAVFIVWLIKHYS